MAESIEDIKRVIKKEYSYLANYFGIKRIGLFGSFVSRTADENSDIDLVAEFDRPIGFKFMALVEYLESKLERKVDLLTPDGIENIRLKNVAENIKKSIIYVF